MLVAIDAVGIRGHGGAAVLCELLHWLPQVRRDWRWHVFLLDRDLREFDDPAVEGDVTFEHTRNGNSGLARLRWVNSQLLKRLEEINPDVLLSFANIGSVKPSIPQIVFVQQRYAFFSEGIPKNHFLMRLRMKFLKSKILAGAKNSNAVVVQTETMRKRMLLCAPQLNGHIHVIPSGFRTLSVKPIIRPGVKEQIDSVKRPRLVYISLPRRYKNHITLIRAFINVLKIFPSASLLLTEGRDDPYDRDMGKVKKDLKQEIQKLGISDHVLWFEWLSSNEVDYAHSASDLMIFPSFAESFGLPLAEAMSVGCPILAADLPYAHEVAGDAAIYFNPYSPEDLAERVISVLKSPETLRNLVKLGKERSVLFSYEKIANQFADIIQKVVQGENSIIEKQII
ncbi:MAG: hypothetical protein A2156_01695 [Deltaproteobacteria bacterium RBG_16_48_10]|nr:MAG: hypothetical protein A2156_01695 [Deltaproteobacteria bacterium RBG_16_48_10]